MRSVTEAMKPVIAGALIALASHGAFVFAAPYVSTDLVLERIRNTGAVENVLRAAKRPRTAETSVVQMDNADTLTAASILDLSEGPLSFDGVVPTEAEYWSISIFAHNTDTAFVLSDREALPGTRVRLTLVGPNSDVPATGDNGRIVQVPSNTAFFLIRATMRDRDDSAGVAALHEQLAASRLEAR